MFAFDVCAVGHVTRDLVRIKDKVTEMPGGTAYYFSTALKKLGSRVSLITKLAQKDKVLLKDLIRDGIDIIYRDGQETTFFENIYPENENMDFRIQKVRRVALPFSIEDIPDIPAKIFHFGPLTSEDIPPEILRHISKQAKISLDIQGFLRRVERGEVNTADWEEKDEGLPYVNILKTDEIEARILTGKENIREAALELSAYDIDEIVITLGSKGSLIYSDEKFYSIPAFPVNRMIDATGCGDTYMAGYIHNRLSSDDIEESGRFAAATASLKLARSGPFNGNAGDVKKFLDEPSVRETAKTKIIS
jgi:sugar/nucleoside kinase (ribokinase family)